MVEWKNVGEVLAVHTGKQLNRSNLSNVGTFPVINGGRTPSGYTEIHNENKNTITISQGGESAGFVSWIDTDFWAGAHCYVVENTTKQNLRFLFHLLKKYEYRLMESKQGAGIPGLNRKNLYSILIPIPSLEEQNRIVGILDTFTTSIDNLKEQIAQRRKQFEHYRNKLLSFKEGEAEWMFISDIADNYTGLTYKPANVSESGTLVLRSSNIQSSHLCFEDNVYVSGLQIPQRALVKQDDVLICVRNGSRALIGKCAMIDKASEGMAFGAFMSILRAKNVNPKYLYYVWQLDSTVKQYKGDDAAPINQITSKDFSKIKVQVPILDRQRTIVQTLDTFEASIKNLEAQLDLRQKQYEYYRNKLLTFE